MRGRVGEPTDVRCRGFLETELTATSLKLGGSSAPGEPGLRGTRGGGAGGPGDDPGGAERRDGDAGTHGETRKRAAHQVWVEPHRALDEPDRQGRQPERCGGQRD